MLCKRFFWVLWCTTTKKREPTLANPKAQDHTHTLIGMFNKKTYSGCNGTVRNTRAHGHRQKQVVKLAKTHD